MVQAAEDAGACPEGLAWLRAKPRTIDDLRDERPKDLSWALELVNLPALLTQIAATTTHNYDLEDIAHNEHAGADTLALCAQRGNGTVMLAVAKHPATTPETIEYIVETSEGKYWVLDVVAYRSDASAKALEFCAKTTDTRVLSAVAQHPNTPRETLETIAAGMYVTPRRLAAERLDRV